LLRLCNGSGSGGLHFCFDLFDSGADEFAIFFPGSQQFARQIRDSFFVGASVLFNLMLDFGQALIHVIYLECCGLLRLKKLRSIGDQTLDEYLLQPLAQVGQPACALQRLLTRGVLNRAHVRDWGRSEWRGLVD